MYDVLCSRVGPFRVGTWSSMMITMTTRIPVLMEMMMTAMVVVITIEMIWLAGWVGSRVGRARRAEHLAAFPCKVFCSACVSAEIHPKIVVLC